MLRQLSINNFAIVRFLELEFNHGMTSITGETGAGKSIAIDALGLCLGNRADAASVRQGACKAEVCACFSLNDVPLAKQWLEDNDLSQDDECILRRTINSDGRSRAYINGNPVPLAQQKSLGQLLVGIHGQHAHHAMLKPEQQLLLLDGYAAHNILLQAVENSYRKYKAMEAELKQLKTTFEQRAARKQLLEYQIEELDDLSIKDGEFERIEQEHKRLANSSTLLETCANGLYLLTDAEDGNIESLLNKVVNLAHELADYDPKLASIQQMLNEALITIQESAAEIERYQNNLELDPASFSEIEARLSRIMQLARKHQVFPQDLAKHHQTLQQELTELANDTDKLEHIEQDLELAQQSYLIQADKLYKSRCQFAKELSKLVTVTINELNMPKGKFMVKVDHHPEQFSAHGCDSVSFLVTANPGQPLQALTKVASGGELSRIGLGIQVITAQKVSTPTLIFDEVDVGISGSTAAIVGKMLRKLGNSTQVLCVTHLPQVAGNGHQHMFVDKHSQSNQTETTMITLSQEQRIKELARLLGGDTITLNTLANAKELLAEV